MSEDLAKIFLQSGLARFDSPNDRQWIGMHPALSLVYMTALADQLAGERGLSPIADNSVDHIAVSGCTVERLAQALLQDVKLVENKPNAHEVEMGAALVALETVVPRNLATVPVDKILKFREKYPAERGIFQQWVAGFVKTQGWLKSIRDQNVFRERVRSEYEKGLKPKVEELREKLHQTGIETVRSCINVKALWRIDTVGVKRIGSAKRAATKNASTDDLIGSLPKADRMPERSRVFFGKSRSHWCLI